MSFIITQNADKLLIIIFVFENNLLINTSQNDMVNIESTLFSGLSWHKLLLSQITGGGRSFPVQLVSLMDTSKTPSPMIA